MVDTFIMSLSNKIEMYAGYPGAQEKEEEWKNYFLGEYYEEYRDRVELGENERVRREKVACIEKRLAQEEYWIRELNEEFEIDNLKKVPNTIFHDTVANRPNRKKIEQKKFQAGDMKN